MSITVMTPRNKPFPDLSPTAAVQKYPTFRMSIPFQCSQILQLLYHPQWRPTSIALSTTTNVTVETTCSSLAVLNGDVPDTQSGAAPGALEQPIWKTETAAADMLISRPITAIRFTNAALSGNDLKVDVL